MEKYNLYDNIVANTIYYFLTHTKNDKRISIFNNDKYDDELLFGLKMIDYARILESNFSNKKIYITCKFSQFLKLKLHGKLKHIYYDFSTKEKINLSFKDIFNSMKQQFNLPEDIFSKIYHAYYAKEKTNG